MKKLLTLALAVVAVATLVGLTFARNTTAAPQLVEYRAGTAPWPVNSAGIIINFSAPMPNTNYAVVVHQTNTAGYSSLPNDCTYFNPLHKTTSGFEVQHKRCDDGAGVKLDTGVSLDYIVIEKK